VSLIGDLLGRRIEARHDPERAGDIKHSLADIAAARAALGYSAAVSFAEGLRRTIDWYKK
jgi:UDP-glucose 4-epimerase